MGDTWFELAVLLTTIFEEAPSDFWRQFERARLIIAPSA
jgi:hypothetical protein